MIVVVDFFSGETEADVNEDIWGLPGCLGFEGWRGILTVGDVCDEQVGNYWKFCFCSWEEALFSRFRLLIGFGLLTNKGESHHSTFTLLLSRRRDSANYTHLRFLFHSIHHHQNVFA